MKPSLTILWPKLAAPEIDEIRFSYDFCRRLSKQLCQEAALDFSWIEYTGDPSLKEMLPLIKESMVLVITHPEIVLSPSALKALENALEKGYKVCGPVYNQTTFSNQTTALPAPYVDMDTYLEVAETLAETENNKYITVDSLDPACVLYNVKFLRELPKHSLLSEISPLLGQTRNADLTVVTGALVHCGFIEAFETERIDLVRLVPEGVERVLDVGCAMGGYGKTLKQVHPEISLTGVELNPIMAESALRYYDAVVKCTVEEADLKGGFDLINCGDILEHLQDPWGMLKYLNGLLKSGGYLVLSIPNAGHWSIVRALLKGEFRYVPLGLLCVGHLRWFTELSIKEALRAAGFSIDVFQRQQIPPTPAGKRFIQDMCAVGYGDEASLRTNEFITRCIKG